MPWTEQASQLTQGERRRDYQHPLVNFCEIALRWTTHRNVSFTPSDVAIMMMETKLARETHRHKEDNWVDLIGYAACVDYMQELATNLGYDFFQWESYIRSLNTSEALYELKRMQSAAQQHLKETQTTPGIFTQAYIRST